jgi:hypothetical protein
VSSGSDKQVGSSSQINKWGPTETHDRSDSTNSVQFAPDDWEKMDIFRVVDQVDPTVDVLHECQGNVNVVLHCEYHCVEIPLISRHVVCG